MRTNRINGLIIASIVLTLATVALTYYHIQENKKVNGWVAHTYEVIQEATELLSSFKDAETGQRGYLITGDTAYLKPYQTAQKKQLLHFDRLATLIVDNPQQEFLLTWRIKRLINRKMQALDQGIKAYDRSGQENAFAVIRTNTGKMLMDSLRSYMATLTNAEQGLLAKRKHDVNEFYAVVDTARYASLIIIAFISTLALFSLRQKQRQVTELINDLKGFNQHLEGEVARRTAELRKKNEIAASLNEELQHSMEETRAFCDALQVQNVSTEGALQEVRDLYNFSTCGYHSLDANGVFVRINETELGWLGYSREELVGKMTLKEILSGESSLSWQKMYDDFKVNGSVYNAELELVRKDGSVLPVLLSSTAQYDDNGNFVMSRSNSFDLTERREMEKNLREANVTLIKVNEEKNNFLGIASHDLKSPLNTVLGLINLLRMDSTKWTPDQQENVNLIFESAKRMKSMIDKLLDLNRIEQGRALVQNTEVEFVGLIAKELSFFHDAAARKNIQLLFEDHPNSLAARSDASILRQIIDNLVSNALKFSRENKKIWVSLSSQNGNTILQVRDEGPGIKPEEFTKLFGKFQKLSARPTGGESSTGLGLSIVKELVTILNGKISCQSAVGVGTVFTVELMHEKTGDVKILAS